MQDALVVSNFAICAAIQDRTMQPWQRSESHRSYTPHTEGVVPQVVMEFLSATYGEEYSVEFTQSVGKWFFYEQVIQVPHYVIFRPDTGHVEVYALTEGRYQIQKADASERYWISELELFLGVWEGTHEGRTGYWLRWWNSSGEMLLWSEERTEQEHQRAEQERQRAEALAEQLRQLGIDPKA
jgi:hypothetical protein